MSDVMMSLDCATETPTSFATGFRQAGLADEEIGEQS